MQQNSNIDILFPKNVDWDKFQSQRAETPFSDQTIEFLNALSVSLLKQKDSRLYPDVVTFAFFCRKANILRQKAFYQTDNLRLGRGIAFHIAPSNVPINFGYSLVTGLLSGNNNIVRISSKQFPQVDLVIKSLYEIAPSYQLVSHRIAIVRYDHSNSDANDFFSSFSNTRIVWGGDDTIRKIRKSPTLPRSIDICFSDRYSFALINGDVLKDEQNIEKIAEGFYNDTYLFDQNACSAPHLVVWTGDANNIRCSQNVFWTAVKKVVDRKYRNFQPVMAVDKLSEFYRQAINIGVRIQNNDDNVLVRVMLDNLDPDIDNYRCAGGYFSEYICNDINELDSVIKSKYQTLAYYGFDKVYLQKFVVSNRLRGIDRIIPIGHTTDFSFTWDGFNLIESLSRKIVIQ